VADDYTILGVLASLAEIPFDDDVRAAASALAPIELRTLDAIHLASALALGDDLAGVLTYDGRMQRAAFASGISVLAPEPAAAADDDQP
jgi:predicted nucleic acid-binding protein